MGSPYDDYEDEEEDLESLSEECGYDDEEDTCTLAGTEHCGFFCPFHHVYFADDEQGGEDLQG